jgi:hypothetical protein
MRLFIDMCVRVYAHICVYTSMCVCAVCVCVCMCVCGTPTANQHYMIVFLRFSHFSSYYHTGAFVGVEGLPCKFTVSSKLLGGENSEFGAAARTYSSTSTASALSSPSSMPSSLSSSFPLSSSFSASSPTMPVTNRTQQERCRWTVSITPFAYDWPLGIPHPSQENDTLDASLSSSTLHGAATAPTSDITEEDEVHASSSESPIASSSSSVDSSLSLCEVVSDRLALGRVELGHSERTFSSRSLNEAKVRSYLHWCSCTWDWMHSYVVLDGTKLLFFPDHHSRLVSYILPLSSHTQFGLASAFFTDPHVLHVRSRVYGSLFLRTSSKAQLTRWSEAFSEVVEEPMMEEVRNGDIDLEEFAVPAVFVTSKHMLHSANALFLNLFGIPM